MKVNGVNNNLMEKVVINLQMEMNIREIFKITKEKDMAFTNLQMGMHMKDFIIMIEEMEKVYLSMLMEIEKLENIMKANLLVNIRFLKVDNLVHLK